MITGWGLGPWGLGSFSSTPPLLSIANARASTTHTVLVTLTAEPRHASGFDSGDATNPLTWQITRLDTGASFTILAARRIAALTYEVLTLEPFASHLIKHRVQSSTLITEAGVLITAPSLFDFDGVLDFDPAEPPLKTANRRHGARDLRNLPAPSGSTTVGGTLRVASGGDYEGETGNALLRKLIIRRLSTRQGDFFHLPAYGVGLTVKEPVLSRDLFSLKSEIEQQVRLEPEVVDASARISLTAQGVLSVQLRVRTRRGEDIDVGLPLSTGGGVAL